MTDWTRHDLFMAAAAEADPMARLAALAAGLADAETFIKAIRAERDQALKDARAIPGDSPNRPRHTIPDLAKAARITETAVKAILR